MTPIRGKWYQLDKAGKVREARLMEIKGTVAVISYTGEALPILEVPLDALREPDFRLLRRGMGLMNA